MRRGGLRVLNRLLIVKHHEWVSKELVNGDSFRAVHNETVL